MNFLSCLFIRVVLFILHKLIIKTRHLALNSQYKESNLMLTFKNLRMKAGCGTDTRKNSISESSLC
jgi:hypothetical protein